MYKQDTTVRSKLFANNVKMHVWVVTNLQLGHDLPTSLKRQHNILIARSLANIKLS